MFLIIARLIKAYSTVLFCNVLRIYLLSDDLLTLRLISEAIGGIVSSDSIVKQIKATSPLQVSSPPKYIKVFICLRSPWALFIMPVIEFLCEKVLWKPLISWVFSRLSWHLTNFVITQIVQGGSTFFLVNETSRSVTIQRNPVTGQCVSEQKLFTLSRALY